MMSDNLPETAEKVLLVAVDMGEPLFAEIVDEFQLLAESAGGRIVDTVCLKRSFIDPVTFIGKGKVAEIALQVSAEDVELVIFNNALSPAQQRNLERALSVRVIDRTALILDIFSQRAQSHEGKLQVELARLQHLSTRLVRMWTHLERQQGGIGLRGGPGEKQIEMDRRILMDRIKKLKARLQTLKKQRQTQRKARKRSKVFSVSIVGYTNAGKSTLFNTLTSANVYAEDRLFATLDTTSRRVFLPQVGQIVVSDTVGFVRNLPHELVAAFEATLEETVLADLLIHVVDASSTEVDDHIHQVNQVLLSIGAASVDQIIVYNKIDKMGKKASVVKEYDRITKVWLSAKTGEGMDILRQVIADYILTHRPDMATDYTYQSAYADLSDADDEAELNETAES